MKRVKNWKYNFPWTWDVNEHYRKPMWFAEYLRKYGYDNLWKYDNIIPDDAKQMILDNFISRRIGFPYPEQFERAFELQVKLVQDKYMKLLETEYIKFDPLVENYAFEEFRSDNKVTSKNDGTTTGKNEETGNSKVTHDTKQTSGTTRTDNLMQETIHGKQDRTNIDGTVDVEVEGENDTNGKSRNINSNYPESNVSGTTGEVLGQIDWKYASTATDSADTRKDKNKGNTKSTTKGTNTTNTSGTDKVNNTGTVRSDGTTANTGTDSTDSKRTNEQNATNMERRSTVGENINKRESKGRNTLPQNALSSYRTFVRGSTATEWLLRQLDVVFFGLFD